VSLGITAPADVAVLREEVVRRVRGDLDDHPPYIDRPLETYGRTFAKVR
jgi:sRNA-binding carbon storage regulator CsrA